MRSFHETSTILASFVVSVYILGFAIGPLVIAPISELYGRRHVYNVCNLLFIIFSIACAVSTNMDMLIVFRFFAGCAGASPLTIGAGTIADMMPIEKRAGAMAIWAMGPLLGPILGPVCAGYLVQAKGWRWVFWILAIAVSTAAHHLRSALTDGMTGRRLLRFTSPRQSRNLCSYYPRPQGRPAPQRDGKYELAVETRFQYPTSRSLQTKHRTTYEDALLFAHCVPHVTLRCRQLRSHVSIVHDYYIRLRGAISFFHRKCRPELSGYGHRHDFRFGRAGGRLG